MIKEKENNPYYSIQLTGANTILTNSIRDLKHNLVLSKKRVKNVQDEFIKAGISNQRFQTHAYGEHKSSAYEGDTESYIFDRRVTINLTLNKKT